MYAGKIHCFYQKDLKKIDHFDSWGVPKQGLGIHRLLIFGNRDEEFQFKVLAELNLPIKWIIFAEFKQSSQFLKSKLNFIQHWRLSGQGGRTGVSGKLFFFITDNLSEFKFVKEDGLWDEGAGIALPSESWNEDQLKLAVNVQVGMRRSLITSIRKYFHCAIVAHVDADGYNILWDDKFLFASDIDIWAKENAKNYPFKFPE
jgi:hypothetical protein